MIFPAWVCHCITAYYSGFSFSTSLPIIIVELHPISNRIRNFLNFALPFLVFINPCRIGYQWLFIFLECWVGLNISFSKLHSDIFFTFLLCIYIIPFRFSIIYELSYFNARLGQSFFFSLVKTHIFHLIQVVLIIIIFQKFWCFMIHSTFFFSLVGSHQQHC